MLPSLLPKSPSAPALDSNRKKVQAIEAICFTSTNSQIYSRIISVQENNISVANCTVARKVKTSRCLQWNNLHWKRFPERSKNRKSELT